MGGAWPEGNSSRSVSVWYKAASHSANFFTFGNGLVSKARFSVGLNFTGNENIDSRVLKNSIKSKTKTLRNIFANNNYKKFIIENDIFEISKIYRNKGYRNINVNYKIEYLFKQ